eukprot:6322951-Prymnesium_polylepis.1
MPDSQDRELPEHRDGEAAGQSRGRHTEYNSAVKAFFEGSFDTWNHATSFMRKEIIKLMLDDAKSAANLVAYDSGEWSINLASTRCAQ